MSSSSLESIIVNAKRLAQRLKSREADADRILAEAEEVNNQLETMRQVSITTDIHSIFKFHVFIMHCFCFFFVSSLRTIWIY